MTVKALKRQLMAAIAMIMVSLIALSSSTYAWFTMNKTVTASGLTVKARTEGGILIKRTIGGEAKDSVTFASSQVQNLFPTSTADAKTWVHAAAQNDDQATADSTTYTVLTIDDYVPTSGGLGIGTVGGTGTGNYYYVYDSFTIVKDDNSNSFTDLFVSECTVKKGTSTDVPSVLSKSLRVAVVCKESDSKTNTYIYAPVEGATDQYTVVQKINEDGTFVTEGLNAKETGSKYKLSANSGTNPLSKVDGVLKEGKVTTEGVEVKVYVYFEGEDGNLTTTNISKGLDDLVLTIKFSCTSVQ